MLTGNLRRQESNAQRLIVFGALVVGLFAVGIAVGSLMTMALEPAADTGTAEVARPGGGAVVDPPHLLQDFTLTSHTGQPLNLSDLRGQAVMMFFGYAHCPDVCPTTLADYRQVKAALDDQADDVAFVFISVDSERDTPDALAAYLSRFDTDFIGLTGDDATLRRMGAQYGLMFEAATVSVEHEHQDGYVHQHDPGLASENYFIQHTSPSFLIDRDGYLRMVYFYGTETRAIADGISAILE